MTTIVRLVLTSITSSPEAIGNIVGINADKAWYKGDLRDKTKIQEKEHGWVLESKVYSDLSLCDHIRDIMRITKGFERNFQNFSKDGNNDIQLSCVIYDTSVPELNFERDIISWLENIRASLDIDLYVPVEQKRSDK